MSLRFKCTACGKCCYGQLPLTFKDALANAERFPIGFVWTPLLKESKDYSHVSKIGVAVTTPRGNELAVLVVPTSFIPKEFECPALGTDNLCSINSHKPARCRAMPFYPYRDERFQSEMLKIRDGWECDTSDSAPLVYNNNQIIDRHDFENELKDVVAEKSLMETYVHYMLKYQHSLANTLFVAANNPKTAHIVTSLSSFLTATKATNSQHIAKKQLPVLQAFAKRTADKVMYKQFHNYYGNWAKEIAYLSKSETPN